MTIQEKFIRSLDRTADWVGLRPGRLDPDDLLAEALLRAGRGCFVDRSFIAPLKHLLAAYEAEADLSVFGRLAARFDIQRSLANILRFEAMEEANPEIAERAIVKPLFISGLPRSGTTFLHTLLGEDPANAVPRSWQLIYPYPNSKRRPDRRRDRVEQQLRFFRQLTPALDGLHPLSADAPQECSEITAQVFQSLRFDTTHNVPSYQRWIDGYGHEHAFRFHRRFLQHLDGQRASTHWALKCPDHVFTLDAVRAVYPDARIVMLHRDPVSVMASVAKLTDVLRRPFTRHVDRDKIGRQVTERWVDGADRMVAMLRQPHDGAIMHLHYGELVRDPVGSLERLYAHWGRHLSPKARARIEAHLALQARGSVNGHRYSLAEYGLDAGELRERFAGYMDAYDIERTRDASLPETAAMSAT